VWEPNKELTGLCGTPDYVAPEVLTWYEDDESGTPYGKGSDLWSLGVLLYVILSGCSPFSADEEEAILQLVNEGKYEFHESEWSDVSDGAKDLIAKLLVVDPATRMTMDGMLQHPWLKEAIADGRAQIATKAAEREKAKAAAKQASKSNMVANGVSGPPAGSYPEAEVVTRLDGGASGKKPGCGALCVIS